MAAKTSGVCDRLRSALSSLCCESAIVTLTLVSGLAITGEILISYGILTAPLSTTSASQGSASDGNSNSSSAADHGGGQTSPGDSQRVETMEIVEKVFHYTSMAIAGIFLVEIILKLMVFRLGFLLKHWQVLDMLIVVAAVMVEVAFEVEDTIRELEVATYVIVFRLWRIPHACNIRARSVQRALEQDMEVWKAGKTKLDEKCRTLEAKNNKQKEKIERLERDISVLRKDAKDSRQMKQTMPSLPVPAASRNGTVPRDNVNGFDSSHVTSPDQSQPGGMRELGQRGYSEDEDTPDGSPVARRRGAHETEREETEDTVDDDDVRRGERGYGRSGSESSLSCQAQEHEVRVQIEEPARDDTAGDMAPVLRKKNKQMEDRRGSSGQTRPVCFDNSGFNPDEEEGEMGGELLHEIDGAKTYRSAEGIPMTTL